MYVDNSTVLASQSQSQHAASFDERKTRQATEAISDDDFDVVPRTKASHRQADSSGTDDVTDGKEDKVESDWSEEDTRAVYKEWKDRKKNKRKRVAAETNRIRAQKKSKVAAAAASSIVGRKPTAKQKQVPTLRFSMIQYRTTSHRARRTSRSYTKLAYGTHLAMKTSIWVHRRRKKGPCSIKLSSRSVKRRISSFTNPGALYQHLSHNGCVTTKSKVYSFFTKSLSSKPVASWATTWGWARPSKSSLSSLRRLERKRSRMTPGACDNFAEVVKNAGILVF
jgi:hypothetical protein